MIHSRTNLPNHMSPHKKWLLVWIALSCHFRAPIPHKRSPDQQIDRVRLARSLLLFPFCDPIFRPPSTPSLNLFLTLSFPASSPPPAFLSFRSFLSSWKSTAAGELPV
uniref:Uncharacterized protein n=1 Tax=Peromyscus maniculatus bairdii TaxID=230844 RepID=A0A8C8UK41_PERMB